MAKLFPTFLISLLLLLGLLPEARPHSVGGVENHNVDIPDAELRKLIEAKIPGHTSGAPITANVLKMRVTTLESNPSPDIRNLTGLEHATDLTTLNLVRPIPTSAQLPGRPRFDLAPLRTLTKLVDITLQGVKVSDMSPLANLTALKYISLNYAYEITRIPDLSRLTELVHLRLGVNDLIDISGVRGLTNLRQLILDRNPRLSDISPLRQLRNLEILGLGSTSITPASLAAVLPFLSTDIDQMLIEEYPHRAFRSGGLFLNNTNISDLSVLDSLPNVFLWGLQLRWMGTRSRGTLFYHLKDLTPLVELMNKGKVINNQTAISVSGNYGLDYPSLYEDVPALKARTRTFFYTRPNPRLEREFPSTAAYRGHPRTRYTFKVRAVNGHSSLPNRQFERVPVTFTVENPDGTTETRRPVLTGRDGLARVTFILGEDGDTHTVTAVVPAKTNAQGPSHDELRVTFTVTADRTVPPPSSDSLTVTFEGYPEDRPTEDFPLTLQFSEPVIDVEKSDITLETELDSGTGTATLVELTPETPIPPEGPRPVPIQTYTATIEVPPRAKGTVTLIVHTDAAIGTSGKGPAEDTASEPIEFGQSPSSKTGASLFASKVAMDKVIFNEIRNAEDDKNDWIELKNISDEEVDLTDYEISIVIESAPRMFRNTADIAKEDADIVAFPEGYTLPAGGILLIVNTHPRETDLIEGQDITDEESDPNTPPQYLIAPGMKLPDVPYLLILRSVRDKNGKPEAFEDLAGNYFRGFVDYGTQVFPLLHTARPANRRGAVLTQGRAWQRADIEKRGYTKAAWAVSGHQSGIGYKPGSALETSLGTPGYPNDIVADDSLTGRITFSEVMYATRGGLFSQPQWIELYNNTATAARPINLKGWKLVVEARDSQHRHRYSVIELQDLYIATAQTVLLVTRNRRHSGHLREGQIYNLFRHESSFSKLGLRKNRVIPAEGFALKLFSPGGTLVDSAGNLDGKRFVDPPRWALPSGYTEDGERTSLLRRYDDGGALVGTEAASWVRAADVALPLALYYGHETDIGSPGYREGGIAPVMLSHFSAARTDAGVMVEWSTVSETDTAGFNILRGQTKEGAFVQVNPTLIQGGGTTADKQHYTYRDPTAKADVLSYYRLEEISLSGERRVLATVRLRGHVSATGKLLWKWSDVKTEE